MSGSPSDAIHLAAYGREAVIWPTQGGRLAAFRDEDGTDWTEPLFDPGPGGLRQGGSYPLAPYSNRIRDGRFTFEGREVVLRPHPISTPHSLHGVAWERAFEVEATSVDRAELRLDHPGDDDWPWRFSLRQTVILTHDGLQITLDLTNTDERRQPVGLGFHPFFPRKRGAHLRLDAEGWWRAAPDLMPIALEPPPPDRDFTALRPVPPGGIDDVYEGLRWPARIEWPNEGLALTIDVDEGMGWAVVFTPRGAPVFCVEPVGHPVNAVNRPGAPGLRGLDPGQSHSAWMQLSPVRFEKHA